MYMHSTSKEDLEVELKNNDENKFAAKIQS